MRYLIIMALAVACADESAPFFEGDTDAGNDSDTDTGSDSAGDVDTDTDVDSDADTDTESDTSTDTDSNDGTDSDSDNDTGSETDSETDTDTVDTDTDTDTDTGTAGCGGWFDEEAGLCWENPLGMDYPVDLLTATTHCIELAGGWRLPIIDELRSFIRGCISADCGVTHPSCLDINDCKVGDECIACSPMDGPGPDGCYWDAEVDGPCEWYWSDSPGVNPAKRWGVNYTTADLYLHHRDSMHYVRCVREWT